MKFFIKLHSHPDGFQWGHQCSWTLTTVNSMQVSIMQPDDCNRKHKGLSQGLNQPCPKSLTPEDEVCNVFIFSWFGRSRSIDDANRRSLEPVVAAGRRHDHVKVSCDKSMRGLPDLGSTHSGYDEW